MGGRPYLAGGSQLCQQFAHDKPVMLANVTPESARQLAFLQT